MPDDEQADSREHEQRKQDLLCSRRAFRKSLEWIAGGIHASCAYVLRIYWVCVDVDVCCASADARRGGEDTSLITSCNNPDATRELLNENLCGGMINTHVFRVLAHKADIACRKWPSLSGIQTNLPIKLRRLASLRSAGFNFGSLPALNLEATESPQ